MNKYEITTNKKKVAIVTTSLNLFRKHGYSNVNMKMIASKSKVSQASIYNYFGNKEELIHECVNMVLSNMINKTDDILKSNLDYKKKIEKALSICTDELNLSLSKFFSEESMDDLKFRQLLIESINSHKREIYKKFIMLGLDTKELNTNIPLDLYLEYIESINAIGSSSKSKVINKQDIEHIKELFLYGLFTR